MKKAIKRFWGIGLIVIILSSFFMGGAVAPAAGGVYTWALDTTQPTVANQLLAPVTASTMGYTDIAATSDGATVYVAGCNTAALNYLYKSTNGGVTWSKPSGSTAIAPFTAALPNTSATDAWNFVACAPDDPNIVAVVSQNSTGGVVFLSTNGGTTFSSLGTPDSSLTVTDIAISAISGPYRYIAVSSYNGTAGYIYSWNYGSAAPSWSSKSTYGYTRVAAVAFSPSFPSDNTLLFVSSNATVCALHAYSYNTLTYDASVDSAFPRVLKSGAAIVLNAASIALDPAFYMGDSASQIGFVGTSLTDTTEVGGISRISTYTVASGVYTSTQIMTATGIGYVAWDGTNLAAAPYNVTAGSDAAITIYRSADSLSSTNPTFTPSSSPKAPGSGYAAKLLWNAGNLLAISRGYNAAIARSTDLGKSFNGISLVNTAWSSIGDFQVSADGSVVYVVANDTTDTTVWRYSSSTWQRVMIMPAVTTQWLVRMAATDPTAVFLGKYNATNMFVSTDSGDTKWTARSCSKSIQDFTAESASIIYAIDATSNVVKSTNSAFLWGSAVNTNINLYSGGNNYSISFVKAGNIVVGGTTGGVSYSSDSGATWTSTPALVGTGSVLAAASDLSTGSTIYATDATSHKIYKWIIGTSTQTTGWTIGVVQDTTSTGLDLANGVLYGQETTGNTTRLLTPTISISSAFTDIIACAYTFNNQASSAPSPINNLQVSNTATSATLWASTATALYSWTEYLTLAANGPTTTYPANGFQVPVNSINGNTGNFVFQWNVPSTQNGAISTSQSYAYYLGIYVDSACKVLYASGTVAATTSTQLSLTAIGITTALTPGQTYYWRVKTTSPVTSPYTPTLSFTVQNIAAAVPVIVSPANGASILNQTPAFSWTPVTGTTQYDFQLSTTPTFGTTVLTDQPNTAGDLVPVTIPLTQGKQYFWRVRALQPVTGDWSAVANFLVATPTTTAAPVTITNVPAPVITIPAPAAAATYTLAPAPVNQIAPSYIWAIIVVGGILVIAVIVLIVRTRRSV
jgi:hypothetical protein